MSSFQKIKGLILTILDQLKGAFDEKHPELANRKCISFVRVMQDHKYLA